MNAIGCRVANNRIVPTAFGGSLVGSAWTCANRVCSVAASAPIACRARWQKSRDALDPLVAGRRIGHGNPLGHSNAETRIEVPGCSEAAVIVSVMG